MLEHSISVAGTVLEIMEPLKGGAWLEEVQL